MNRNLIVDISDAKISRNAAETLVTYSLGSCIGVALFDPVTHTGGLLHFQLPDSRLDPDKAISRPCMFADTGLKLLVQSMVSHGCHKRNMRCAIAGGASMANGPANFEIGKRNHLSIRKCMWKAGLMISAEDVGGSSPRNLYINLSSGRIEVRSRGVTKELK